MPTIIFNIFSKPNQFYTINDVVEQVMLHTTNTEVITNLRECRNVFLDYENELHFFTADLGGYLQGNYPLIKEERKNRMRGMLMATFKAILVNLRSIKILL